jgi:ketosteroid isomerase-like protein
MKNIEMSINIKTAAMKTAVRRSFSYLLYFACLFIPASCDRGSQEMQAPDLVAERAKVEQTIRNNLGWAPNKDFDLLKSTICLDSTYLVVNPTDRVAIGEDDFRANEEFFGSPDFQAVGFEISDLRINFSRGGDVAWFYCHLNDWNTWKGQPANWENARWTGVLEKIDGAWKIRQMHFSYAR